MDESRKISDLKTYRDIIEKLVIPKLTAGMFTDQPIEPPNGSRTSFTTTRDFYSNTVAVYLNGVRQHIGDSGELLTSGNRTLVFKVAPIAGDKLLVDYVPMDI